jgi:hypothetical protein
MTIAPGKPEPAGINLRIIDADLQLDQAFDAFERTLKSWAGGRAGEWRTDGPRGVAEEGATYARRDDVYLFVSMTDEAAHIGIALMPSDRSVLDIGLPRRGPGRDRRRAALASDDEGRLYLLAAEEALRLQGVREPFRRMAGHAFAKRARVGGRDYLMLGPLTDPGAVDALLAVAALHPAFEAHLDRLARIDAPASADLWRASDGVARLHRGAERAVFAAAQALRRANFILEPPLESPFGIDLSARRGEAAIAICAVREPSACAIAERAGALCLAAPTSAGYVRALLAPAAREPEDRTLLALADALADMEVSLVRYDIRDDAMTLTPVGAAPGIVALMSFSSEYR